MSARDPNLPAPPATAALYPLQAGNARRAVVSDPCLLGRSSQCDLQLDDSQLELTHCLIFHRQGQWFVRDIRSSQGTWVNGQRIGEAPLRADDTLRLGTLEFRFVPGSFAGEVEMVAQRNADPRALAMVRRENELGRREADLQTQGRKLLLAQGAFQRAQDQFRASRDQLVAEFEQAQAWLGAEREKLANEQAQWLQQKEAEQGALDADREAWQARKAKEMSQLELQTRRLKASRDSKRQEIEQAQRRFEEQRRKVELSQRELEASRHARAAEAARLREEQKQLASERAELRLVAQRQATEADRNRREAQELATAVEQRIQEARRQEQELAIQRELHERQIAAVHQRMEAKRSQLDHLETKCRLLEKVVRERAQAARHAPLAPRPLAADTAGLDSLRLAEWRDSLLTRERQLDEREAADRARQAQLEDRAQALAGVEAALKLVQQQAEELVTDLADAEQQLRFERQTRQQLAKRLGALEAANLARQEELDEERQRLESDRQVFQQQQSRSSATLAHIEGWKARLRAQHAALDEERRRWRNEFVRQRDRLRADQELARSSRESQTQAIEAATASLAQERLSMQMQQAQLADLRQQLEEAGLGLMQEREQTLAERAELVRLHGELKSLAADNPQRQQRLRDLEQQLALERSRVEFQISCLRQRLEAAEREALSRASILAAERDRCRLLSLDVVSVRAERDQRTATLAMMSERHRVELTARREDTVRAEARIGELEQEVERLAVALIQPIQPGPTVRELTLKSEAA